MTKLSGEVALRDGGRLAYDDHSDAAFGDRLVVVLIHGFALDRRMWAPQVSSLSDRFRLVAVDLRGFGGSSAQVSGGDHVEDLERLLDALGLEYVNLVGLSLGANVALTLAMRYPARARRLVLASPGLPGHRWNSVRPTDEVAAIARTHGVESARLAWRDHALFGSLQAHPAARALAHLMIGDYDGAGWAGQPAAVALPDATSGLAATATPTLVINGELDLSGYLEIGHLLAEDIPRSRRLVVAQAGHLVNLEQPTLFSAEISSFIARETYE